MVNSRLTLPFIVPPLMVFGCSRVPRLNPCPNPVEYSKEFQENLMEDLNKINSFYINQMLMDFYNINQQLRICDE